MIPKLYSKGVWVTENGSTVFEKSFEGMLHEALSCKVTQTLDSGYTYTLEMKYPITGAYFHSIKCRSIIYAAADAVHAPQLFEVYRVSTPINGVITVYAQHVSYMLASLPVPLFDPLSASNALYRIQRASSDIVPHGFTIELDPESDISQSTATMGNAVPRSVRSALVGDEGSFVDTFGGEIEFDDFKVTVKDHIGEEKNVRITYGFNMTAFEHDENMTNVYTGIYPYAVTSIVDSDGNYINGTVTIPEHVIYADENTDFKKIKIVDLTAKFTDNNGVTAEITPDNLYEAAQEYIRENQWGVSSVNIKVSFVPLDQTEEYKDVAGIEGVSLGDSVMVDYPAVGIKATARCVKTVYDSLADRYDSIEIGKAKKSIVNTIAQMRRDIKKIRRS